MICLSQGKDKQPSMLCAASLWPFPKDIGSNLAVIYPQAMGGSTQSKCAYPLNADSESVATQ